MCDEVSSPLQEARTGPFTPADRLRAASEFRQVFSKGKRHRTSCLTMVAYPNQLGYSRLGLAISKKAIRLSVGRNRVKRQIRESFRHHRHLLSGFDVVVSVAPAASRISRAQLREMIDNEWSGVMQICAKSSS